MYTTHNTHIQTLVGVYGLFALPFLTLGMEKSIYDTVQAWQGIDPNVRPKDRGGFPSGGAGKLCFYISFLMKYLDTGPRSLVCTVVFFLHYLFYERINISELPSFSLIAIRKPPTKE